MHGTAFRAMFWAKFVVYVVIEDLLRGEEASIFALCDGFTVMWCSLAERAGPQASVGRRSWTEYRWDWRLLPCPGDDVGERRRRVRDEIITSSIPTLVKRMVERGTPFTGLAVYGASWSTDKGRS